MGLINNSDSQGNTRMRSLSKDITLIFVLVVSVISVLATIFSYYSLSHKSKILFEENSIEYIAFLRDSLEYPLWRLDNEVIVKVCSSFANNEAVALLRVTDNEGVVIYEKWNRKEVDLIMKSARLSYNDLETGLIELGLTPRIYREKNNELLIAMVFIMLLVTGVLALTTKLILQRLLQRPLDYLIERTKEIAAGEFKNNMQSSRHKEIASILAEFNSMAEEVEKREQSLLAMNEQLEIGITERIIAEEALVESKARLHVSLRASNIGPWDWNFRTNEVYFSPEWKRLIGYEADEIENLYEEWESRLHPEDRGRVLAELNNYIEGKGQEYAVEFRLRHKDGSYRWIFTRGEILNDTDGNPASMMGCHVDVTDHKMAEERLNESEIKYRTLFEQSADAFLIIEGGKFVDCNPATINMLGYTTRSELLETHPSQLSPKIQPDGRDSFEKANEMMSIAFEQGSHRFEWDHKRRNGEVFPVEVLLTSIPIGERHYLHVVWRDITERKKMEEELLQAQKLESIGLLAGGIAHDFNNLLTAIMNNLFLMKNHISPEEKVFERIIAAERASARAQGLTQQLLTFSKGGSPIKGLVDVRELVGESISIALRGSNVRCESSIPYGVWHVEADAGQMNQAINNIIINADQAMPEGGTIAINCENTIVGSESNLPLKEGNYIKLSIKDQGTGISGEHQSKIFDPYFTTKQKGSGLGLSTTYSIIKKHDGHINLESKLGTGTVFNIYLPASMEKVMIKQANGDGPLTGTGRVLIMDDDELVRDSLGQMLIHIGYVVEFAGDGREAIDIYKNVMASDLSFDAVIMDLTIPGGMGGQEAIEELIKINPHVKAIVSSGYSYDPIMSNYIDYGFRAVLTKPYNDIRELNRILTSVIKGE